MSTLLALTTIHEQLLLRLGFYLSGSSSRCMGIVYSVQSMKFYVTNELLSASPQQMYSDHP